MSARTRSIARAVSPSGRSRCAPARAAAGGGAALAAGAGLVADDRPAPVVWRDARAVSPVGAAAVPSHGSGDVDPAFAQRVEHEADAIEIGVERFEQLGARRHQRVAHRQPRFHPVRELAETHRAGHARAALERVQRAAQLRGGRRIVGDAAPSAQLLARPAGRARRPPRGRSAGSSRRGRRRRRAAIRRSAPMGCQPHGDGNGVGLPAARRFAAPRTQPAAAASSDELRRRSALYPTGAALRRPAVAQRRRKREPQQRMRIGRERRWRPACAELVRRRGRERSMAPRLRRARSTPGARRRRRARAGRCLPLRGISGSAGGDVRERLLAQLVEFDDDVGCLALVAGREAFAALHAAHEMAEAGRRAREHRLRDAGERRAVLLERQQRLLQRARGRGDQRDAAGAVDAAQRMARAHHRRDRPVVGVELQHRHLVLQQRDVLIGLVAENSPQRRRQAHVADDDFVGLGRRARVRRARRVGEQRQVGRMQPTTRRARPSHGERRRVVGDDAQHGLAAIAQIRRHADVDRFADRLLDHRHRRRRPRRSAACRAPGT